ANQPLRRLHSAPSFLAAREGSMRTGFGTFEIRPKSVRHKNLPQLSSFVVLVWRRDMGQRIFCLCCRRMATPAPRLTREPCCSVDNEGFHVGACRGKLSNPDIFAELDTDSWLLLTVVQS